jgi:hypothetical protein
MMMEAYLNIRQDANLSRLNLDNRKKRLAPFSNLVRFGRLKTVLLIGVVVCVGNLTWLDLSFGFGLEVDPVEIVIKDCPLGEKAAVSDLGGEKMKLRIQNQGTTAYTYTINTLFSSEAQDRLREGYIDIPDTFWIIPENKEVRIPPKSTKEVELYLEIPKKEECYDKKYQAIIEVKSKKNRPEEVFVLAVQIRMCFSTIKMEGEK